MTLIVPNLRWNCEGKKEIIQEEKYTNQDGVRIIRLKEKKNIPERKLKWFPDLYPVIAESKPDILFIHGCQFLNIHTIISYLKKNNTTAYLDNHADYNNSAKSFLSKKILHGVLWKFGVKRISPYIRKFYGVTPSRVDFLIDEYKLQKRKVELLVMGADDETIEEVIREDSKNELSKKYGISTNDFVIVAGGKIDRNRKEYLNIIQAVKELNRPNLKLFLFGSISEEVKDVYLSALNSSDCAYVKWLNKKQIYEFIYFADLAIFPCLHSVMWEETAGIGTPAIYRELSGFDHLDYKGNCYFIENGNVAEIQKAIEYCMNNSKQMKKAALGAAHHFLYSEIAKRAIQ
ncbi:MAG: glycosyltransferase [Christensenellaceae bacterium]|nr:glycosyltransferase [Christensenellaceae bacterium]